MKIGFLHLGQRSDTWAKYYLWVLRNKYPQHEVVVLGEDIGYRQFKLLEVACDIYLHIDDGMNYEIPALYRPLIYVCSDSHIADGIARADFSKKADYSFCCQKSAVGTFGQEWLPHAAYYFPPDFKDQPHEMKYDISSVMMLKSGHSLFGTRTQLAMGLKQKYPRSFIETGPVHEAMADIYARSLIVWNYSINEDISMRLFEAAAAGACILTNRLHVNKVEDVFGDLAVLYEDEKDLHEKAQYLLAHRDECVERGRALKNLVAPKSADDLGHTYEARVKRVLEVAHELIQKKQ